MQVPRSGDIEKARFRAALPDAPDVVVKPMFGNLGAFVHGNMFAGVLGSSIGVRVLDEQGRADLLTEPGAGAFGPEGRPMGGYVGLDASVDEARVHELMMRSYLAVAALPAKVAKPGK